MKTCQTAETYHSQSTKEPENATSSYVPGDGTNGCAFLSVVFGDHLLCQNERSTVTTFEEIACLAEEVIVDSPL